MASDIYWKTGDGGLAHFLQEIYKETFLYALGSDIGIDDASARAAKAVENAMKTFAPQ